MPNRHLTARSAMASNMAAAVSTVALFLTRAHGLLLRRRDDGLDLLPFPFMNLLDLPPLLLHRERRIRAHRCCNATLETPATSQQGSTRARLAVPGAVTGPLWTVTWALAFSASGIERMIPASIAASKVLFHNIESLLRTTQTHQGS